MENYKTKGLSNRFVNNIYSITELRSRVFKTSVNLLMPYDNVRGKEFSFKKRRMKNGINFLMFCRRVRFSYEKF